MATNHVLFITRDESEFPECYANDGTIAMMLTDHDVKAMLTGGLDLSNDKDVFTYVNHLTKNGYIHFDSAKKSDACRTFEYSGEGEGRCSYADILYNIKHGDEFEFPEDLEALHTLEIGETRHIAQWMGIYFDFTRIY